jgi:hypothetical protein
MQRIVDVQNLVVRAAEICRRIVEDLLLEFTVENAGLTTIW